MATILLTWELGSGIGHLMNLRPIGQEFIKRGYRVVAAIRELSHASEVFAGTGIDFLPAPILLRRGPALFEPTHGYAQILGNVGFADSDELATLFSSWNTILDTVRPDFVVADHSPTALLALRGRSIRRVNVGLGFFCPPDTFPLPIWLPAEDARRLKAQADEQAITDLVNRLLEAYRRPKLQRLAQIFNEIDGAFLATYPEFDHFGARVGVRYWGHWPFGGGTEPSWPEGNGPRIYAYLKPYPGLETLLTELQKQGAPTIVLSGGINKALQTRFSGPRLRFEAKPLDLRQVAAQCDLAILNAGHGTTAAIMLAGKPCLLIPLYLEQLLFARKAEQTGAARALSKEVGAAVAAVFQEMIANPAYREKAGAFASRYAGMVLGQQIPEMVDRMERLCGRPILRQARIPAR